MGLSHHLLLTLNCVSYSPKWARQWYELTPARVLGATVKAVAITQLVTPANCSSQQSPTTALPLTPLFSTGPCLWVASGASEICDFYLFIFFNTVTMYSYKLNVGGCWFLAGLNYYLQRSPAPAVSSLIAPQIFQSQRVKSQKLCKGCYLWQVCLCSVKNTCDTPGWRTIAQITLVRGGSSGCINGGLRIRSGFLDSTPDFFSFPRILVSLPLVIVADPIAFPWGSWCLKKIGNPQRT